ncbi:MAG: hypothetical protein V2I51_17370 [Anderseniella sp.]|jgi:hypothetical protein|nr:hypothetical protein [Anderseniella sp.]
MTPITDPMMPGGGMMYATAPVDPLAGTHGMLLGLADDVLTLLAAGALTLFLALALSQLTLPLPLVALGAFLALLGTLLILLLSQSPLALALFAKSALTFPLLAQLLLALTISFNGPAAMLLAP